MRLIDADALRIRFMLPDAQIKGLGLETVIAVRDVMDFINTAPTVEPKRGGWKPLFEEYAIDWAQCSECGTEFFGKTNYCPNCGVKMDGGIDCDSNR